MIAARDLDLGFGKTPFLRTVSLQVEPGVLLAIVGPNSAGKTTLLRALAGQHRPHSGSVLVDGRPIAELGSKERSRRVALVEADGPVPDDVSVYDVVAMGRLPYRPWWSWSALDHDEAIIAHALQRTQLGELARRPFGALSSGERQRAWMALALAQQAQTLLLDEPTSHLDIRHAFEALGILRALTREGYAAAVVLHDLNLASAFADRIAVLGDGCLLVCAPPAQALDETVLRRAYGVTIRVRAETDGRVFAFADPDGTANT